METRLAKRRRFEAAAQQARERNAQLALERNIAHFVGLGVPPGVVRKVLPMARLLRRVLPLPDDMVDQVALHYLWDIRRRIRYLWSWLTPVGGTDTNAHFQRHFDQTTGEVLPGGLQTAVKRLMVRGRWFIDQDGEFDIATQWWHRYISRAIFTVETTPSGIEVITEPWTTATNWMIDANQRTPGANPFFPPNRV